MSVLVANWWCLDMCQYCPVVRLVIWIHIWFVTNWIVIIAIFRCESISWNRVCLWLMDTKIQSRKEKIGQIWHFSSGSHCNVLLMLPPFTFTLLSSCHLLHLFIQLIWMKIFLTFALFQIKYKIYQITLH